VEFEIILNGDSDIFLLADWISIRLHDKIITGTKAAIGAIKKKVECQPMLCIMLAWDLSQLNLELRPLKWMFKLELSDIPAQQLHNLFLLES
jgi:hypothetical protein